MNSYNLERSKNKYFRKGSLIISNASGRFGVMIKKSFHDGYYYVFSEGRLREWHISNIDVR